MSAKLSNTILKKYVISELENILDQDTKITHSKLTAKVENLLVDEKQFAKLGLNADLKLDLLEWCYTPIIQSGKVFDLKVSAQSNSDVLHPSVIIISLGVRLSQCKHHFILTSLGSLLVLLHKYFENLFDRSGKVKGKELQVFN
jgi:nucleosome binding factor SPN SPT16 subunit